MMQSASFRMLSGALRNKQIYRRGLAVLLILSMLASMGAALLRSQPALAEAEEKRVCICPYAEHAHTAECFDGDALLCGYPDPHVHDETCYDENGQLCCDRAVAHLHDESCYDEDGNLICTLPEIAPHRHDESCYQVCRRLICENTDEDHEHTDACYEEESVLVCTLPELPVHVHTEDCFTSVPALQDADDEMQDPGDEQSADDVLPERLSLSESYLAADGSRYTVTVEYGKDAGIPDGAILVISEPTPEEYADYLAQVAEALDCEADAINSMRLLDITIVLDGKEVQPNVPVSVKIRPEDAPVQEDTQVVHFGEEETEVMETETKDGDILFASDGFSVYAIVETAIETVVLASDGNRYQITVTCPPDAGVPEDAVLSVTEITEESDLYDEYAARSETLLGWDAGSAFYVRPFDIKILDADGQKIEIAAPVDVQITLLSDEAEEDLPFDTQVIHFADDTHAGDVVEGVEITGETVRFAASGFSAYVIVVGPGNQALGWYSPQTMDEFRALAAGGLYIGHTSGYYFKNVIVSDSGSNPRTGIGKTKPAKDLPDVERGAVPYYFEPTGVQNQYYIYCYGGDGTPGNTKQYVRHTNDGTTSNPTKSLSFTDNDNKTAFTVSLTNKGFTINDGDWYWNMQGGANGSRFCVWNSAADTNNYLVFWQFTDPGDDPFRLDGKKYGLMNYANGITGIGMMATSSEPNHLDALTMTVLTHKDDSTDQMFVPKNTDLSIWTFHWVEGAGNGDIYTLSTKVGDSTKYLEITAAGLTLSDSPCNIRIVAGTGFHSGEVCLKSESGATLTYGGSVADGFSVGNATVGSEWLNLVELSLLTEDYYMTYSADKVSVSDPDVTNGSKIILYTRSWNETKKRYDFYAVDHDGTLVQVFESGNTIQWIGNRINTLLWDFTEYYWAGTTESNGYYEFFNEYSQKYIAPQLTGNQLLSDHTIGVNLNGRKDGYYYSTILAWDDASYAYVGLKVVDNHIVPCPKSEAMDFYFAIMQDQLEDDRLHPVPTIDNELYGITMKMINFNTPYMAPNGNSTQTTSLEQHTVLGDSTGGAVKYPNAGLLSTNLGPDGYPIATKTGISLSELYVADQLMDVNHLFIQSTHDATGYFEFNSSQNSATLIDPATGNLVNDFTVYQELATHDKNERNTLKHGQFLPYNSIQPGFFAEVNPYNNYSITAEELPNSDPRKGERLYKIADPDFYFGMELEASFVQPSNGKDAWDHDIIYEFTGDDDFWLYVDGELVIDLGGIHSALNGSVNYCTGEVKIPNRSGTMITTSIYDIFRSNYEARGMSEAEIEVALDERFMNDHGNMRFKDYTAHTMKIFFMERGAGASNLHMRFNLSSVKKGTVQLSKKLSGVDATESILAEFPYQVFYTIKDTLGIETEYPLTNRDPLINPPVYVGTTSPVRFLESLTFGGVSYSNVYMLRPGETAEIEFPDQTMSYRLVECGVNTDVYDHVFANDAELTGTEILGHSTRKDYGISGDSVENRSTVIYDNHVREGAMRNLTITKKLYDVTGVEEIHYDPDHPVTFSLRLYFSTEFDDDLVAASMHTYHVKDDSGNYCRWDGELGRFISLGETDYDALSAEQKAQASFYTSPNGSISKIPAFYTVEVREVLAGTQYKVEERNYEIPDGYSRMKYVLYDQNAVPAGTESLITPPVGTIPSDETERDPHVDVCNVKGFGLRVYKNWSDKDYLSYRDPTYFAVFIGNSATPISGTVKQLPFDADPETLYWYFDTLESGYTFADYTVREVAVVNPTVDADGLVTAYDSLDRIDDDDTFTLNGTLKGDSGTTLYTYLAHYHSEVAHDTNVRVYTVINVRKGIVIQKLAWGESGAWGGEGLSGAKFKLLRGDLLIGEFTSVDSGWVTEAYLSENVPYTLIETLSPQGHYGLQTPLTLTLSNGVLTVTGDDPDFYRVTPATATDPLLLEIRNRSYNLRFEKQDGSDPTHPPLEGVHFALHKEITINGVTQMDFRPMAGYEDLVTDENGIIPLLDNTLVPGSYCLRETQALPGYAVMTGYLNFLVDYKGDITILDEDRQDWLNRSMDGDTIVYSFSVPNVLSTQHIKLIKYGWNMLQPDAAAQPLSGAVFTLYASDGVTPVELDDVTQQNLTSANDGVFFDGYLLPGSYYLEEVSAPAGYTRIEGMLLLTIDLNGVTLLNAGGDPVGSITEEIVNVPGVGRETVYTLSILNLSDFEMPMTGGSGTLPCLLCGGVLTVAGAVLLLKRRKKKNA